VLSKKCRCWCFIHYYTISYLIVSRSPSLCICFSFSKFMFFARQISSFSSTKGAVATFISLLTPGWDRSKNTTVIFFRADFVLSSDGLALSGARESTKTYSVRSALTNHFLYSSILIFLRIGKAEFWFRYILQGMDLLLPVVLLEFSVSEDYSAYSKRNKEGRRNCVEFLGAIKAMHVRFQESFLFLIVEEFRGSVEIKCQLDATEVFIADLIACSTCFGHHYAHH